MKITFSLPQIILRSFAFSLILLLLLVASFIMLTPAHAQNCEPTPEGERLTDQEAIDKINKCAIERNVFDDKIFNINQISGTTDSIYNLLTGKSRLHPETDGVTAGTGALAASGKLVASLYSRPPVSGVEYFAQQIDRFNPVQPVHAQEGGIGFSALQPVQKVWTVFRNVSYVGFVIVFVVIGFMIMFRAHISPQAVATVQDSVPRIVVALILVTFSYAIAGLFIDVMFLLLNVMVNALQTAGLLEGTSIGEDIFEKSVFGVVWGNWKGTFTTVADALSNILDDVIDLPLFLDDLIGFFGGTLGAIVVGIALLFIMFRVFFMLLMAYVMIIILTMAAPFFFLFQALPGRNGAGEWFKQMASQISVFPTVALMFVFAGILGGLGGDIEGLVGADQVGQFPLLAGDINPGAIGKLIGVGLLLMTPSAAELVRNALGVRGGGAGIAGGLAGGMAVAGAAGRGAWNRAYTKGPLGEGGRQSEAIRQERSQLQAREKIYQKPERVGMTRDLIKKRGLGYGD